MTFAQRIELATQHEQAVLNALRGSDWDAEPFGQGQLTEHMRGHLRRYTDVTPLRWIPDIIAARRLMNGRSRVVFIDAKAGDTYRRTGNYDVEVSCLETAEAWSAWTKCPVYYVFTDLGVASTEYVREFGTQRAWNGNGSGTPFLVFPRAGCSGFGDIFGTADPSP